MSVTGTRYQRQIACERNLISTKYCNVVRYKNLRGRVNRKGKPRYKVRVDTGELDTSILSGAASCKDYIIRIQGSVDVEALCRRMRAHVEHTWLCSHFAHKLSMECSTYQCIY